MWDVTAQVVALVVGSIVFNLIASYIFERFKLVRHNRTKWLISFGLTIGLVVGVVFSIPTLRELVTGGTSATASKRTYGAVLGKIDGRYPPSTSAGGWTESLKVKQRDYFEIRLVAGNVGKEEQVDNLTASLTVDGNPECLKYIESSMTLYGTNINGEYLDTDGSNHTIKSLYGDGVNVGSHAPGGTSYVLMRFSIDCALPTGHMSLTAKMRGDARSGSSTSESKMDVYWR